MATIAVYLVTFRRPALLRRSLASVLNQTHRDLVVRVVNDDPTDPEPARIVADASDPRARIFRPVAHRGGAANFNLMLDETEAGYVSLLEDDNWWEPRFLETMLANLEAHPGHSVALGNERIWRETADDRWENTGQTIWHFRDTREHYFEPEEICGSAQLVNSAMLIRLAGGRHLRTPDTIPVDVTEHFRERRLGPSVIQVGEPLVNYAETLQTARSTRGGAWGEWQALLIGSVFVAAESEGARRRLAERLWAACPSPISPRAVSLVGTGLAVREARALLGGAPGAALVRFGLWAARRPGQARVIASVRRRNARELDFLVRAPLTVWLAERLGSWQAPSPAAKPLGPQGHPPCGGWAPPSLRPD